MDERFVAAGEIFLRHDGILRMSEAIDAGISRSVLYAMRDEGVIEQLSRGLYRLASLPALEAPDLITTARRIPKGVICLVSALAFHELTTQIPHAVDVAILQGSRPPRVEYPPTNIYYFSGAAFSEGVETHKMDGVKVRVYNAEKSITDMFKYRNKLGLDIAIEALKTWRKQSGAKPDTLLGYARICRVEKILRPYLEALL